MIATDQLAEKAAAIRAAIEAKKSARVTPGLATGGGETLPSCDTSRKDK